MNARLDCAAIDELDAAFALGALEPDEADAVSEHLRSCPQPHRGVRDLSLTAASLPSTLEPVEPSPGMRERLMESIEATPQEIAAPALELPLSADDATDEAPARGDRWMGWLTPRVRMGLAAATVVALIALGAWNVQLRGALTDREELLAATASAIATGGAAYRVEGTGGRGYLVITPDGAGSLIVAGLGQLAEGERYQMWLLRDGEPVVAGSFTPRDADLVIVPLERPVTDYGGFAVTVESLPVDAPSGEPVMVAQLTD